MKETICAITEDRRGSTVSFDSGDALWISRRLLSERSDIAVGGETDVEELRQWLLPRQYVEALDYAVSLLAARARASGEIEKKLKMRRYLDDTVEMVLYKLEKEKLLNDEAFARDWAASRARRQMGKSRIMQELRQKGVSREMAERALEELDEQESSDAAAELAKKLLRRHGGEADERKAMNKIMAAMARRGYGYDDSRRAVEAALQAMEEE